MRRPRRGGGTGGVAVRERCVKSRRWRDGGYGVGEQQRRAGDAEFATIVRIAVGGLWIGVARDACCIRRGIRGGADYRADGGAKARVGVTARHRLMRADQADGGKSVHEHGQHTEHEQRPRPPCGWAVESDDRAPDSRSMRCGHAQYGKIMAGNIYGAGFYPCRQWLCAMQFDKDQCGLLKPGNARCAMLAPPLFRIQHVLP